MYTELEEYLAVKQILEEYAVEIGGLVHDSFSEIRPLSQAELSTADLEALNKKQYQLKVHENVLKEYLRILNIINALKEVLNKVYGYIEVVENEQITITYDLIGPRRTKEETNYLSYSGGLAFKQFRNLYNYDDIIGKMATRKLKNGQIPVTYESLNDKNLVEDVFRMDGMTREKKVYLAILIKYLRLSLGVNAEPVTRQYKR